jgi:hypothetical protein
MRPMPYTLIVQEAPAIPISFVFGSTTIIDQVAKERRPGPTDKRMQRQKFLTVFIFIGYDFVK